MWMALATLILLELVLGIDNIIFISILANKHRVANKSKRADMGFYWEWW